MIDEVISKIENCVVLCVEEYQVCDHKEILKKCSKVVAKYTKVYELHEIEAIFTTLARIYEYTVVS